MVVVDGTKSIINNDDDKDDVDDNRNKNVTSSNNRNNNNDNKMITILGFGSLLSERSSRMTYPHLQSFRLGYVPYYRRVFGHPTSIFLRRNIANYETKEMSSLAVELCHKIDDDIDDHNNRNGIIVSVFEIEIERKNNDRQYDASIHDPYGLGMDFLEREEEFDIIPVPYYNILNDDKPFNRKEIMLQSPSGMGMICTRSTDEAYIERWGYEKFHKHFIQYGIDTIWNWSYDSNLLPCSIYLRHCYLAAQSMGNICLESFLYDTYLVDRKTTIQQYIQKHPEILQCIPPPEFIERYSG